MPETQELAPEIREKQRALEVAFVEVFGEEARRTSHQKLVWEWLASTLYHTRPIMQRVRATQEVDQAATAIAGCYHDVFLGIQDKVTKGSLPENPLNHPKPHSVRE